MLSFSKENLSGMHRRHTENLIKAFGALDGFLMSTQWCGSLQEFVTYTCLEPLACVWSTTVGSFVSLSSSHTEKLSEDPLHSLRYAEDALMSYSARPGVPASAGFLAYELLHTLEEVEHAGTQSEEVPLILLYFYKTTIKTWSGGSEVVSHSPLVFSECTPCWRVQDLDIHLSTVPAPESGQDFPSFHLPLEAVAARLEPYSNFSAISYARAVHEIKERIRKGLVYQVNLSQQFRIPVSLDPTECMLQARRHAAAPRQAAGTFAHKGKLLSFISASPELFFRTEKTAHGTTLATIEPIKGTRPRHDNEEVDRKLGEELLSSEKDNAELAMIVDLVRNDLGRVAKVGSVQVVRHAELKSYPHVHHLVSEVSCELESTTSLADVVRAIFPCGSITGAPKIAAMETISELEGVTRGIWTGSVGTLCPNGEYHFNVAIRTALVQENQILFNAGGGVTIDSDPEEEYWETIAKSRSLLQVIDSVSSSSLEKRALDRETQHVREHQLRGVAE